MQNLLAITSMLPGTLVSQQLPSGDHTVFTCPASTAVRIFHGTLCNVSGSAVTVSLSVVPNGGTLDGSHKAIAGFALAAGDTLSLKDYLTGAMLAPGDFISVNSSAATAVDVVISGLVCT
jgi:hypothetical protein